MHGAEARSRDDETPDEPDADRREPPRPDPFPQQRASQASATISGVANTIDIVSASCRYWSAKKLHAVERNSSTDRTTCTHILLVFRTPGRVHGLMANDTMTTLET